MYRYLKSTSNDANGAYNAGFYWCYYFEIPQNIANESTNRGNAAKNVYWPVYGKSENVTKVVYTRILQLTGKPYMSGTDIKYVQECLKNLGYTIDTDGIYGPNTETVVKRFQKDYGLTGDGKCATKTWTALENAVQTNQNMPPKFTKQPESVTADVGSKATFTAAATGEGLTYVWYISNDSGKTWASTHLISQTYTVVVTANSNKTQVRCLVMDKYKNKVNFKAASITIKDYTNNSSSSKESSDFSTSVSM